jgi:DNA polymerase-3 subunit gamma/tau
VPVTVLSRCLQFNLKNMPPAAVAAHLATVLSAEGVDFERGALDRLGRAAAGSMRDALSLLDQAIAFGGGEVREPAVREMLGVVDAAWLVRILDALVAGDGRALVGLADEMLGGNAPFERTLADLAALLQRIALAQVGAVGDADDPATLERLAAAIAPEDLQVWYQIVIHGARDLPLAPDAHAGFTMVLLRLLAFGPDHGDAAGVAPRPATGHAQGAARGPASAPAAPAAARPPAGAPASAPGPAALRAAMAGRGSAPAPDNAARASASGDASKPAAVGSPPPAATGFDGDWPGLAARLQVGGFVQQFMHQSELVEADGLRFRVRVPIRPLAEPATVNRVREALGAHFGAPVRLDVEVGRVGEATAAAASARDRADRQAQARASIEADPFVRALIEDFDGAIVPGSVRPIERRDATTGDEE